MASTKLSGRTQEPIANAARSVLNGVKSPDFSTKSAKKDVKVEDVVEQVSKYFKDASKYDKELNNASVTSTIQQIRALLNQLNEEQIQPALEQLKSDLSTTSLKNIIGNLLMSQITSMFDDDAKASDIEDLKQWMSATFGKKDTASASAETSDEKQSAKPVASTIKTSGNETTAEDVSDVQDENAQNTKDGDYDDSTPAKNFSTLQSFVNNQFLELNDKLKNIPGQTALLTTMISGIVGGIGKIFSGIGSISKNILGGIKSIAKTTAGAFSFIGNGIKSIGSKVGKAITSPFKAVGGFFKSLNPFNKSKENAENRKQKAKDKVFDVMSKILEKIWKLIEPFVEKVAFFMGLITKFVIVPIAIIMTKILLVVAAIVALGLAAYLVYTWVKDKIAKFWKYITSGEMLDDIIAGLKKTWEWIVDFGKWIWDIIVKALRYIFVDMWVDLAKWLWEQITKFWNWIYDKFIGPYIVEPIKKVIDIIKGIWEDKIKPIIQPFIDSLMSLYEKIKTAFSAWDTNKSIWENLKNIGGIIKDSVIEWWNESPFKKLWDETVWPMVKPFIESLTDLKNKIVNAFRGWDTNKSIWENLKNIGNTIKTAIIEWWSDDKNPIKAVYNKYIAPIVQKIQDMIDKLGNMIWSLPVIGTFRPFGFLAGKDFFLSGAEEKEYKEITSKRKEAQDIDKNIEALKERLAKGDTTVGRLDYGDGLAGYKRGTKLEDVIKDMEARRNKLNNEANTAASKKINQQNTELNANNIAQQQVNQAMKPINSISNMNADTNLKLQKEGQMMSQQIQEKEEKQQEYDASQYSLMGDIYKKINETYDLTEKNGKDPTVITTPVPVRDTERRASIDAPYSYAY